MDFTEYLNVFKKNWILIIVFMVIFGALAFVLTNRQATTYQSSIALEVNKQQDVKQSNVSYYQYDNYYNVQAAAAFSDNIVGWMTAPSTAAEIFKDAGYDLPKGDLVSLGKEFVAKKNLATSSVVNITYSSTDPDKAEKLIKTAAKTMSDKVSQFNTTESGAKFSVFTSDPVVVVVPKQTTVNTVVAVIVALLLCTGISFARESLKK